MVETLEHWIRQGALHPRRPRQALYRELLRSEAFLLSLDAPLGEEPVSRVMRAARSFPVWADKDPELGGVWVPVFPARDSVALYVSAKRLRAPAGKEFLWMGHKPGTVFGLLRGVKCFAGVRLYLQEAAAVDLTWSQVRSLSEGRLPQETPELYELPVAELRLPVGSRLTFGRVDAGPQEPQGKLLCLPEAGHFRPDDIRKLVRLRLGGSQSVWMACRHFLQVLRLLRPGAEKESGRYFQDMLCSLMGFQMYGEAEALCEWLAARGSEAYAWVALAAIYGRNGKLSECAALCRKGAAKYPDEKSFPVNGARALARLGRAAEARPMLEEALQRFPQDPGLVKALGELSAAP